MSNILQMLVDSGFDAAAVFFNWLFDGWITKDHNLEDFYKNTKLTVDKDLTPILKEHCHKDTYEYFLFQVPTGMCLADFEKRREQFAFFYHAKENQIKFLQNKYDVEMRIYWKKEIDNMYNLENFINDNNFRVPIGINLENHKVVYWSPSSHNECHLLIAGNTGSGKSVALNLILTHIIATRKDVKLYLQDTKVVDLYCFKDYAEVYNEGTDYAEETISSLVYEMRDRYDWLKKHNSRNLADCKSKNKPPFIFYVLEELASFNPKNEDDKPFYAYLQELLSKGRAAGIFVIVTTQAPYSDILPGMIKNNFNTILGLKTRTGEASKVVCGDFDRLQNLRGEGHGVFFTATDEQELQVFNITDEIIKESIPF